MPNMGMPVQVFPTGGLPKAPPPPPPQQKLQLNGNKANSDRKSPLQTFEPPPFGCRPEIKIPANPMATLRPVPKPKPKDDFWVEEYRKERSKSPMVQGEDEDGGQATNQSAPEATNTSSPKSASPALPTSQAHPPPPQPPPSTFVQQSHLERRPVVECERLVNCLVITSRSNPF